MRIESSSESVPPSDPGHSHGPEEHHSHSSRSRRSSRHRIRSAGWDPETVTEHGIHRFCDLLSEALIAFMLVFSPWAFGTTQPWSIWTMNICGYALGVLWVNKLVCRRMLSGHWSVPESERPSEHVPPPWHQRIPLLPILGALTIAFLLYVFIASLNVRAVYNWQDQTFSYRDSFIAWLPMTYDGPASLDLFWNALALACTFWAIIDWMRMGALELALSGPRYRDHSDVEPELRSIPGPPQRWRRMLWLLAVHGALLSAVGLIQRADGGAKLLWIMETRINREAISQFGPYAYRSNAAQYLNLLWPVVLGFWWWLDRSTPRLHRLARTRSLQHMLLPMAALIAIGPIVSLSRAGALVGVATCLAAGMILVASARTRRWRFISAVTFLVGLVIAGALYVNGDALMKRFKTSQSDFLVGRESTYELARQMAKDYPVFGTGPGTFESVFSLYRNSMDDYWPSQLHHDWLEFLITLGWVGFSMLCALMVGSMLHPKLGRHGMKTPWPVVALILLGMAGCLVHARADFPFQIYSIQLLFIALCAVLVGARGSS